MLTISLSDLRGDFSIPRLHELRLTLRKLGLDDTAVNGRNLVRAFGVMGALNLLCSVPRLETTMRIFGISVMRRMLSAMGHKNIDKHLLDAFALIETHLTAGGAHIDSLREASAAIEEKLFSLSPGLKAPHDHPFSVTSLPPLRKPLNLTEGDFVLYHLCLLLRMNGYEADFPWYAVYDMNRLVAARESKTPMAVLNFIVQTFRRMTWIPKDDDNMFDVFGPSPFSTEKKFLDAVTAEMIHQLDRGPIDPDGVRTKISDPVHTDEDSSYRRARPAF